VTDQTDLYRNDALLEPVDADWAAASPEQSSAPVAEQATRVLAAASLEDLVRAREAIGFRAADVASMLGMATRQVDAIERGDWKALPGQAFIRSAIRAYGKAVGTDVGPLLETMGGAVPAPSLIPVPSLKQVVPKGGFLGFSAESSGYRMVWIVVGLAAIVAIAFHFGGGVDGTVPAERSARLNPAPKAPPMAVASAPAAAVEPVRVPAPAITPAAQPPSLPAPVIASVPASPAAASPAAASPPAASPPAASPAAASPAAASRESPSIPPVPPSPAPAAGAVASPADPSVDVLVFRFDQESWVEIREAGGKVVHLGLQPAGTSLERSGRRPLALVVGNAAHVKLERNGAPVDLSARSPAGVARFTID
jgi:cytoskeleton protein RodZ